MVLLIHTIKDDLINWERNQHYLSSCGIGKNPIQELVDDCRYNYQELRGRISTLPDGISSHQDGRPTGLVKIAFLKCGRKSSQNARCIPPATDVYLVISWFLSGGCTTLPNKTADVSCRVSKSH